MKILFSPSKGMVYKECEYPSENDILFKDKTDEILKNLKNLSLDEVATLFKVKGKLLEETFNNIKNYETLEKSMAIALYDGVTFKQLNFDSFNQEDFEYIDNHLLIFSALYGVVKGTTLIKPYRLDMTVKALSQSPYKFWEEEVNGTLEKDEIYLNLASKEFSKIVNKDINMVTVEFRQEVQGKLKNISTEAKKARGIFLNHIIKNKINSIEDVTNLNLEGYSFDENLSDDKTIFFVKK